MSEPWGAEVFRVPDISWQTQPPPTRHPIPARYVPDLEVGDEVTIGVPGHYFLDGQLVASLDRRLAEKAPGTSERQETLAVAAPFAYWLAKAFPSAGLTMQWWPMELCWVYRDAAAPTASRAADAPASSRGADAPASSVAAAAPGAPPALTPGPERTLTTPHPGSWLEHVQPTLAEPPVRRPSPAREAGSLTGRTVRLQHERGAWSWWIAVSEPTDLRGDFVVQVMRPSDYWLAQAACEPAEKAQTVRLHRLYTC
jgi:hypothetical protein